MKTYYLAGAMTGLPDFNFPTFNAYAALWRAQGYTIINPADHGVIDGGTLADYMAIDLPLVAKSDGVLLIPGWETSKGANLEIITARFLDKPVRCAKTGDEIPPDADFIALQTVRAMIVEGLKKHGKESWRAEDQDNHLDKSIGHVCDYKLIRDGNRQPDGELHLRNAICRLAMGLWQHENKPRAG